MTAIDLAQVLLTVAVSTPAPTPPPADPAHMYPKDWWTVVVGVVAGLGGAVAAGVVQAWKAKHDYRAARDAALWEYHRVLTDISADISGFMGDTVEGYDDGSVKERIKDARKAAWPYFYLFPEEDRPKLKYPTSNDRFHSELHEDQKQIDAAIQVIDTFLLPKPKKNARSHLAGLPLHIAL